MKLIHFLLVTNSIVLLFPWAIHAFGVVYRRRTLLLRTNGPFSLSVVANPEIQDSKKDSSSNAASASRTRYLVQDANDLSREWSIMTEEYYRIKPAISADKKVATTTLEVPEKLLQNANDIHRELGQAHVVVEDTDNNDCVKKWSIRGEFPEGLNYDDTDVSDVSDFTDKDDYDDDDEPRFLGECEGVKDENDDCELMFYQVNDDDYKKYGAENTAIMDDH